MSGEASLNMQNYCYKYDSLHSVRCQIPIHYHTVGEQTVLCIRMYIGYIICNISGQEFSQKVDNEQLSEETRKDRAC